MTGPEPGELPDELADGAHEEIRRLLAEARHAEPMPAEVAARMDVVLAELAAGRPADDTGPPRTAKVVSLSAHRRRRAGGLMVAAAAIVVAGVAVTQHLPDRGSTTAGSSTAGRSPVTGDSGAPAQPGVSAPQSLSDGATVTPELTHGRVVVRARTFPADASAAQRLTKSYAAERGQTNPAPSTCVTAPVGSHMVPATFRGARAALVFLLPEGDTQVVDLYLCGHPQPIRSVTLPAP